MLTYFQGAPPSADTSMNPPSKLFTPPVSNLNRCSKETMKLPLVPTLMSADSRAVSPLAGESRPTQRKLALASLTRDQTSSEPAPVIFQVDFSLLTVSTVDM